MATEEDTWATNIKKELQERPRNPNRDDLDQFEQQNGLLLRNNLIYVPEGPIRLKILRECHDNTLAGHFGIARTHELVLRTYWWPKMNKLLREYVKSCDTCARSKAPRHRPFGLLQPLSIPSRPWESIAMDFITDLPTVRTKNSILLWLIDSPNGLFHPLFQVNHGRRDNSVNSGRDRPTTWTPGGNCVQQRSSVCIQVLASSIRASWS